MGKSVNIIFPNQLLLESELLTNGREVYLIEEFLFFKQFKFHKQKVAFHRASMMYYRDHLESKNIKVHYIDANHTLSDIRNFHKEIKDKDITDVNVIDFTDYWLEKRLKEVTEKIDLHVFDDPQFINTKKDLEGFFRKDKKSFFQTTFYKQQRKKLGILLDENEDPIGGNWTYDKENRKKYPKGKTPPQIHFPASSEYWSEAIEYTKEHFKDNPGELSVDRIYPFTHKESQKWFEQFLDYRFHDFGPYEDAMVREYTFLNHSVLSPLINTGLLLPDEVVDRSLAFAKSEDIPINSTEGFVRQIIGWREFIRGMYECKGNYSRTKNYWNFKRRIPQSFYDGTTGILPVDDVIKRVLKTGYCHHIERLMILGNFMMLCEFDPDEVYRWFMELFIDAYDWVMVPNIYGMSQFADGGTFATKPYISGSNYVRKMSNFPKGDWQEVWDGLFWRFMAIHESFFKSSPRLSMLVSAYHKMPEEKKQKHMDNAEQYMAEKLDNL